MTADLLRQAADRLDEAAKTTTPGPWQIEYSYGRDRPQGVFVECPDGQDCDAAHDCYDGTRSVGGMDEPGDNVWASLLGPQVAAPLSAWLRAEAACMDSTADVTEHMPRILDGIEENMTGKPAHGHELRVSISTATEAIALATAILGEQP